MDKNKSFVSLLIATYKNDDGPFGDLARDVVEDKKENKWFKTSYKALKNRIETIHNNSPCSGSNSKCLKLLDELYNIYKNIQKNEKMI